MSVNPNPVTRDVLRQIATPLSAADVVWRATVHSESPGLKAPFAKVEAVARRLDEHAGPENWQTAYSAYASKSVANGWCCRLSLRVGDEWLARDGVGSSADDAFVAAAEWWGVGRYLRRVSPAQGEALPAWALPASEQGSGVDGAGASEPGSPAVVSVPASAPASPATEPRVDEPSVPPADKVEGREVALSESPIASGSVDVISPAVGESATAAEGVDAATGHPASDNHDTPTESVIAVADASAPEGDSAELPLPKGVEEAVLVLMHEIINRGNNGVNITSLRAYAKKKKDQGVFNDDVLAYVTAGLDKAEQKQKAAA